MVRVVGIFKVVVALLVYVLWQGEATAQDLTPRLYWPAPQGTKVLVTGITHVSGDVIFDRTIPLYGVDSDINVGVLAYMQTLRLWGRTGSVLVDLPYSWGYTRGFVGETPARRDFSGLGDLKLTLSINLLGAPSMTVEEFLEFRTRPRSIVGASVKVVAPTGNYYSDRLINVGANRWSTRLQLGSVIPVTDTWLLELEGGVWFFTDDDDFLPGRREQDPIFSAQANLVKRIRPGLWASLDVTYFGGGRQTIGGVELDDEQHNLKVGGTVVIPFGGRHAIKFGYANGVRTEYGSDFDQFLATYQILLK